MKPARSEQPAWLAVFRRGARILERPGRRLLPLTSHSLVAAARRRTGLTDFGDTAFAEPLDRLVRSIEMEARLNLVGRVAAREDLTSMLINNLRLEHDRRRQPGIAAEEIRRPLFITGLPRSGSTFLHGLLAQDPANRVPLHWEMRHPSPPPERAKHASDPRIAHAASDIRWFFRLAPEFSRIHPVGAQQPEECVIALSHSFLSFQFSSTWFVPSYHRWLERQDLRPAYRYHRRVLQQLQWRCPGERWVLKAPPHLPGLRALFFTYPDANVIMTHRDPLEVVASVASLHVVLRRTFSDFVHPHAVGLEVTRMLADDIRRGFEIRDDHCAPSERFIDIRYPELIDDPLTTVRRIYRHFGFSLSAEAEARMRRFAATNTKESNGPHVYSLGQFGLESVVERKRYRAYWERWGRPAGAKSMI